MLADVGRDHRLVLITKGDLVHQTRKVTTSGLAHHFEHVEVVLEKDVETYARILPGVGVEPSRFCMVGNSVRSDILPVLALGGHAVHIPYPLLWEHEHVDHDEDLDELASITELPAAARGRLTRTRSPPMDARRLPRALCARRRRAARRRCGRRPGGADRRPAPGGRRSTWSGTSARCTASGRRSSASGSDRSRATSPNRPAGDRRRRVAFAEDDGRRLARRARGAPTRRRRCGRGRASNDVAFVARRMAHETAVHRYDAERAAGREPARSTAELASDGIDEFLFHFLPWAVAGRRRRSTGPSTSTAPTSTASGSSTVADGGTSSTREHAKGDAAVRGPAHDLLIVLWRRQPLDAVEVIGDPDVAERLIAGTRLE